MAATLQVPARQVPFVATGKLVKLTIDLGASTVTPQAMHDLQMMLAARNLPIVGGPIGDFEGASSACSRAAAHELSVSGAAVGAGRPARGRHWPCGAGGAEAGRPPAAGCGA